MDPNACWKRFITALRSGDLEEAVNAASDLAGWMRKSGGVPDCCRAVMPHATHESWLMMLGGGALLLGAVLVEDFPKQEDR